MSLHSIIGAGAAEGAIDAASILKPSLARGQLRLIGATTMEEYHRFIEKTVPSNGDSRPFGWKNRQKRRPSKFSAD